MGPNNGPLAEQVPPLPLAILPGTRFNYLAQLDGHDGSVATIGRGLWEMLSDWTTLQSRHLRQNPHHSIDLPNA